MSERAQVVAAFIVLLFVAGVIATLLARAPDAGDIELVLCTTEQEEQIIEAWRNGSPLDLPNCVPTHYREDMDTWPSY